MKGPKPQVVDRLTRSFAKRHGLEVTRPLVREKLAIRTTSSALGAINESYARLDDETLADPAIGVLLNMLHRNFEHVEGATLAFVTGSGASAEVVARAATEFSVTILYVLSGARNERLAGWFDHYLRTVAGQIKNWRRETLGLDPSARLEHERALLRREQANDAMRSFAGGLAAGQAEPWPATISARFSEIGKGVTYRTVYARMSSEGHADAEETLRFMLGKVSGLSERMALETIMFSRFLLYCSVDLFLHACQRYAETFGLKPALPGIFEARIAVRAELAELSKLVGAD